MKRISLLLLAIVALLSACVPVVMDKRYTIKVVNNSNQYIGMFDSRTYPDTSLPINRPYNSAAKPRDYGYIESATKWENIFNQLPKDTLSIYIFNMDTLKRVGWDSIRTGHKILKRYDLSLQDLKSGNWTITYP
jgi:hypothetical protein